MDDIRGSLSKMKKKFKHRLTGGKRKPDETGAHPGGEGANSTGSLLQPDPHVVTSENYDQEGDRASAAGERVFSTDPPPQPDEPEPVPARGSDSDQEGGEVDADGGEASQERSHPRPDVEIAVGSGELEGTHSSPSTPSISHGGKPDGT